jgi:hypothetical protein
LFKSLICPFQLGRTPGQSVFRHSATCNVGDDRLITDIEAGEIDVVVVYKVDRSTRALSDFANVDPSPI